MSDQREAEIGRMVRGGASIAAEYAAGFLTGPPDTLGEAYLRAAGLPVSMRERHPWYRSADPLDILFCGAAPKFHDSAAELGSLRTQWLRRVRGSALWPLLLQFVRAAADTAMRLGLPLDSPHLALALCGPVHDAAWAHRPIPAALLPAETDLPEHCPDLPPVCASAAERTEALWRLLGAELACDGTISDTLREGLYTMGIRSRFPASGPHLLITALAMALGCPVDAPDWSWLSAFWWYCSLPENSPLHTVLGIIWQAEIRNLTTDRTLTRLFSHPAFDSPLDRSEAQWRSAPALDLPPLVLECGYLCAISRDTVYFPGGHTCPLPDITPIGRTLKAILEE